MYKAKFFLGANSPSGFSSLYDGFVDPEKDRLRIIKSGPGSGKSTFMRIIAEKAAMAGESMELIQCSGDPDSLDGVYFPSKRVGYVDGTSPHVTEPGYSGSGDVYVDLSRFYDYEAIRAAHGEIMRLTDEYKAWYQKAYMLISSAHKARQALMPELLPETAEAARKRMKGIILRELPPSGKVRGTVKRRFLRAITCKGELTLFETVPELAERVYILDNEAGLALLCVEEAAKAAERQGWDTIRCLSPLDREVTEQLILPELSLAFVSVSPSLPYSYPAFRRLRLDALLPSGELKKIREAEKLPAAITGEAIGALRRAKELHDLLEREYNPYVDFDGVRALANEHAEKLFG